MAQSEQCVYSCPLSVFMFECDDSKPATWLAEHFRSRFSFASVYSQFSEPARFQTPAPPGVLKNGFEVESVTWK